ncbi:MAG: heavy-metal-associated domain-containing protein [Acidimicrobiia bacterium]|nr:heavy-metal-associated domain-containing protein [Acidimicrobiia bacterium]
MATVTFRVEGMSCNHCVQKVKDAVGGVAGVTGVDVDLATGEVAVVGDDPVDESAFRTAIDSAGYAVVGVAG